MDENVMWRERLSGGLPDTESQSEDLNGAVLVSEMGYLRDAGVPQNRLVEIAASMEEAGRSVKNVKAALRREAELGPKALRGVVTAWLAAIDTVGDAQIARDHFAKLAKATTLAQTIRDRAWNRRR